MKTASSTPSGHIPFFVTLALVAVAVGGIGSLHGQTGGMWLFGAGLISLVCLCLCWAHQSRALFASHPRLAYAGLALFLLALVMFLFSGILERGYDVATRNFGVNGKIDDHINLPVADQSTLAASHPVSIQTVLHLGKVPITLVKAPQILNVRPGQNFDLSFSVKNRHTVPIKFRVLVSVVPATSATAIKARQMRYPMSTVLGHTTRTITLPLHLTQTIPKHTPSLIIGLALFQIP